LQLYDRLWIILQHRRWSEVPHLSSRQIDAEYEIHSRNRQLPHTGYMSGATKTRRLDTYINQRVPNTTYFPVFLAAKTPSFMRV